MDPLLKMTEQKQKTLIQVLLYSGFCGAGVAFLAVPMLYCLPPTRRAALTKNAGMLDNKRCSGGGYFHTRLKRQERSKSGTNRAKRSLHLHKRSKNGV